MLDRDIFKNAVAVNEYSKVVVYELRRQNYDTGIRYWKSIAVWMNTLVSKLYENISEINSKYMELDLRVLMAPMETILKAQEHSDYLLMSDMIELQLLPMMEQIIQMFVMGEIDEEDTEKTVAYNAKLLALNDENLAKSIEENYALDKGYFLEYTNGGEVTLRIEKGKNSFYMAGNNSVFFDGYLFAEKYYNTDKSKYIVAGLGMIMGVAFLADKDCEQIDVYESDINVIKAACRYYRLPEFYSQTGVLKIHYDPDFTKFAKAQETADMDETEVVIYQPFIKNIDNINIRRKFEELFLVDSSIRNQKGLMVSNFKANNKAIDKNVDELREKFEGKDVYIIAAGPSLDNNVELLKNKPKNSVILATGTVFKKLTNMGIDMDYFIVSDANVRVRYQISGYEKEKTPLLVLSTASKHFAKFYQGEKYIIYQKDFELSKDAAEVKGNNLYSSGGSVTTAALDVSMQLGAKRIIFLGLDLAYTNNLAHATGTSRREHKGNEGLMPVEAVDGTVVYSNNAFNMFRQWIERRIADNDGNIIDATEGGAKIKGTKICRLIDVLEG